MENKIRTKHPVFILAVILCSFLLHIYLYWHRGGYWRDEIATINLAKSSSVSELFSSLKYNTVPLFYPLVIKILTLIPNYEDEWLKIIGMLIGIAPVLLIYFFNAKYKSIDPLIYILIVGFIPGLIRWEDSIRGYGLGCLTLVIFLIQSDIFIYKKNKITEVLLLITAIIACQTSYQNWVFIFTVYSGLIMYLGLIKKKKEIYKTILALGIIGTSLVPYYKILQENKVIFKSTQLKDSCYNIFVAVISSIKFQIFKSEIAPFGIILLLVFIPIIIGLYKSIYTKDIYFNEKAKIYFYFYSLFIGILGSLLLLISARYIPNPWHLCILITYVSFILAKLWKCLPIPSGIKIAFLSIIFVAVLFSLRNTLYLLSLKSTNVDAVALFLEKEYKKGDIVIVNPWYYGISLKYFLKDEIQIITIPPISRLDTHREDELNDFMESGGIDYFHLLENKIRETCNSNKTIWFVGEINPETSTINTINLPHAPDSRFGWMAGPFQVIWGQALYLILKNYAHSIEVYNGNIECDGKVIPYEFANLLKIR